MSDLAPLLGAFLAHQRWFAGSEQAAAGAVLVDGELLRRGPPGLLWALVQAGGSTYQLLVGLRPEQEAVPMLQGQEMAVLGQVRTGGVLVGPGAGPAGADIRCGYDAVAYDALADPALALIVLEVVTAGAEQAERVRPVGAEQSNSSMVFDDRLILKVFRRVQAGPNPDVEVALALDRVGFNHVAAPAGHWRRGDYDLAIAQEFLHGGTEGWALALTSLRDLYGRAASNGWPPEGAERPGPEVAAAAGGDFGAEARRLGEMTARLHLALGQALGQSTGQVTVWSGDVARQVSVAKSALGDAVGPAAALARAALAPGGVEDLLDRLGRVGHPGCAIRVHGDYHLGQVMRTDQGWFVLDFEGEPARPLDERRQARSPLKDVAGMLRSLGYATAVAIKDRGDERAGAWGLDRAWEERNRASFLQGYLSTPGIAELLPHPYEDVEAVLEALEVEKAAYELAYELAYRPHWADIPARALSRLLLGTTEV